MTQLPPLPIEAALPELLAALGAGTSAVLIAPPGAGKTTRVPLALLDAAWLMGRKILVLEPRRVAARAAATHMATLSGDTLGGLIGLKARLTNKTSARTRIEVVTEGVFTRMILDDPELSGIGAVLFDEFHERSLDADFGLALALDARAGLRPDLRLVVMSATLEGGRVSALLGAQARACDVVRDNEQARACDVVQTASTSLRSFAQKGAPVIRSEGRAYPVETRYIGRDRLARIEDAVTAAITRALSAEQGSILAFLPGQGEIARVAQRLDGAVPAGVTIVPLHGGLEGGQQDAAVSPARPGQRKVVLATAIAETSLTIEGVRIVIDSGLARVPRYEPDVGLTRLATVRVSNASADQRRGRAGRLGPGVCYRLWDEPETMSLAPFADPAIKAADLSGLLLDCAEWGTTDPASLSWLDPPPKAALEAARAMLESLDALDSAGRITGLGRRIRALPLPPRLASMLIAAAGRGQANEAALLALILVERGAGGTDIDLGQRLQSLARDPSPRARDLKRMARGWAALTHTNVAAGSANTNVAAGPANAPLPAAGLLATAFPDRIAKARGGAGQFQLASGRGAFLDPIHPLARAPYLVAAEVSGAASATRILAAMEIGEAEIETVAGVRISARVEIAFDPATRAVRAKRIRRLDAIALESNPVAVDPDGATAALLAVGLAALGIDRLPWTKGQAHLRERVAFLRDAGDDSWPDVSDANLAATAQAWLAPWLVGRTRGADVTADDLEAALAALLPHGLCRRLDAAAPTHFAAPTGNRHAIDYASAHAPAIAIRVQELYGLKAHPAIAGGRRPLTLTLLSPAHRPIQITRDLPGFWAGSWGAVKAEMRGRYPRHPWPDDPAAAAPTTRVKGK